MLQVVCSSRKIINSCRNISINELFLKILLMVIRFRRLFIILSTVAYLFQFFRVSLETSTIDDIRIPKISLISENPQKILLSKKCAAMAEK